MCICVLHILCMQHVHYSVMVCTWCDDTNSSDPFLGAREIVCVCVCACVCVCVCLCVINLLRIPLQPCMLVK